MGSDQSLLLAQELHKKIMQDKITLQDNNDEANTIAFKTNEYNYFWLKSNYYNNVSLSSIINEEEMKCGWFVWLKNWRIKLDNECYQSIDGKNTAIYSKYFKFLLPCIFRQNEYLDDAIFCFQNERYYACACTLFSALENVERKISSFDGNSVFKMAKSLEKKQSVRIPSFNLDYFKEFEDRMNSFLSTYFYSKSLESDAEPIYINRNRVMHGIFTRNVNKTDCLKLFVLINSMIMFNDWLQCYRKMDQLRKELESLVKA